jgi:membrane fusion protein (multidrug efflux system)
VNENNVLQKSEIKTGTRKEGYLEVVSGLISGEKVVAEGLTKVRPNMKIKPIIKP